MGGLYIHTLGGIDINYVDPATSSYFVEDMGDPPEEKTDEGYVTLNNGSGARLARFTIGEAPHVLNVIALGDTQTEADDNRDALQDVIDSAVNGDIVLYEYQADVSEPEPESWRVLGGRVRPRWRVGSGEQIFALAGRYIAPCRVTLTLSRG